MSLRLKINLIVSALTLMFSACMLLLAVSSMRQSVREEVVAASNVASQLLNRTAWRYAAQGSGTMVSFLRSVGRVRSNDITLLDPQGRVLYQSPPSLYKAGRDAPRWFARWVSPQAAEQSINFPQGQLVMRANASRAVLDAWDDFVLLALAGVTLVLVANALVFVLVGRATRPFGEIVRALKQLQSGKLDARLPALAGREAHTIGAAFNQMAASLQDHIDTERRAMKAEAALSDSRDINRWIDERIEHERLLIARELHDELGQSVTAVRSMALSIVKRSSSLDASVTQAAQLIADESSRLYDAMHGMIPRLSPLVLDHLGLPDALQDLAQRTRLSHPGVEVSLHAQPTDQPWPEGCALTLYRAAREGITNALRHGQATRIVIELRISPEPPRQVVLSLTDNGKGLDADWRMRAGHYGLRWLSERAQSLGGHLHIEGSGAAGTQLQITLPLERT